VIHDIRWRKYKQSEIYYRDLDAVVLLHAQQEEALGRRMDLPAFRPPVVEAWVAERNEEIVGGMYCEAVIEPVMFGRDPVVSASARRFMPEAVREMQRRGFRMVRLEVPRWIGKDAHSINRELERAGFDSTDPEFHHYRCDLRQPLGGSASRNGQG
jgi:hypothetical protein